MIARSNDLALLALSFSVSEVASAVLHFRTLAEDVEHPNHFAGIQLSRYFSRNREAIIEEDVLDLLGEDVTERVRV